MLKGVLWTTTRTVQKAQMEIPLNVIRASSANACQRPDVLRMLVFLPAPPQVHDQEHHDDTQGNGKGDKSACADGTDGVLLNVVKALA